MKKVAWVLPVLALAAVGLLGCGGGSKSSRSAGSTPGGAAGRPSCGTYCVQAGLPAGQSAPGYPCPQSGCLSCPPSGCVALLSRDAVASGGLVSVNLKCNLTSPCRGALLLCFPFSLCEPGAKTASGAGGRLAASDFTIPAGGALATKVALTPLGEQVARLHDGYRADVIVDVADYGIVNAHVGGSRFSTTSMSHASLLVTSTDPGAGIRGASVSCGGAPPVFVGPNTSCSFARAVFKAWEQGSRPAQVTAASPVTKRAYKLHCSGSSPVVCTGGVRASVVFFV